MKYFNNVNTIEELKEQYKQIIKKLHPDLNKERDTTKDFQEMQKEYNIIFNRVKNKHKNANGETYEQETNETPQEFTNIINELIKLEGLKIDLVGSWIWLTGETYKHKDKIKELKFKWCNNKKAWSFHFGEYKRRSTKKTLDEIKEKYGVKSFESVKYYKLGEV